MHSTNYYNTFIAVAEDCSVHHAEEPPKKDKISLARALFELIQAAPYSMNSDQLILQAHAITKGLDGNSLDEFTHAFYSKGQPCLRLCALVKRYGWGLHFDKDGKVALVPLGSDLYKELLKNKEVDQKRGMKSKR